MPVEPGRDHVVWIGKTHIPRNPASDLRRKLSLIDRYLKATMIVVGPPGVRLIEGVQVAALPGLRPPLIGGLLFYVLGPIVAVTVAALSRGRAIVCQSPFEAVGVVALSRLFPTRRRPRVVIEVHGDWRTATRLYGHPLRGLLSPLADKLASWALLRTDRVRVVGETLRELVVSSGFAGEIDKHVTFSDFSMFLERPVVPIPDCRQVAFAGVFQRYKAVDVLLKAWREVARELPDARLVLAGDGPMRSQIQKQADDLGLTNTMEFVGTLARADLATLLDQSAMFVLPSRSEGLPRVVFEAMARGRPVVATPVGDIPNTVQNGVTGILVPVGDHAELATAMTELLSDRVRSESMGRAGRRRVEEANPALEFELGIARLADWVGP